MTDLHNIIYDMYASYCSFMVLFTANKLFFYTFQGKDEFLGSSVVIPSVRQESSDRPKLDWIEIVRCNKPAGEVLAAFELSLQELKLPSEPSDAKSVTRKHKPVPKDIAPKLQKKRIEVHH